MSDVNSRNSKLKNSLQGAGLLVLDYWQLKSFLVQGSELVDPMILGLFKIQTLGFPQNVLIQVGNSLAWQRFIISRDFESLCHEIYSSGS